MKTDLSRQTKYYKYQYNKDTFEFELEEIPLNRDNWVFVQLDGCIRYVFLKYKMSLPKYVVIQELPHHVTINIYRGEIENEQELFEWHKKRVFLMDELQQQAEANSTYMKDNENWVIYKFNIL